MSHPLATSLRSIRSKLYSLDAILDLLAAQTETPDNLVKSSQGHRGNARRLQLPRFGDCFAQLLLSAFIGVGVAYSSALPFASTGTHGESSSKAAMVMTCTVTTLLHLVATTLDGTSHELNPKRSIHSVNRRSISQLLAESTKTLFVSVLVVPIISIGSAISLTERNWDGVAQTGISCSLAALVIAAYLQFIDQFTRILLCSRLTDLKQLIVEVSGDDSLERYLDVVLYSILHSNIVLVKSLGSPHLDGAMRDLEMEERNRNACAIKAMAETLLEAVSIECGAPLEEDILRVAVLESVGGKGAFGTSSSELDSASDWHVHNIKLWVQPDDKLAIGGKRREPLAVPLVRALCAYAGGLGEAMQVCTSYSATVESLWLIPPGAIACAEYAIRSAARCLVWNFSNSDRTLNDWRGNQLSILLPVVLHSAFRLEAGVIKYAMSRANRKPSDQVENKLELIKVECPELLSLFLACNQSAVMILQKVFATQGKKNADLKLDDDCSKWVNEILPWDTSAPVEKLHENELIYLPYQ